MTWILTEFSKENGTFLPPISYVPHQWSPGAEEPQEHSWMQNGVLQWEWGQGKKKHFLCKRNRSAFPPEMKFESKLNGKRKRKKKV